METVRPYKTDLTPWFLEGERIAHLNNEIALNVFRAAQEPLHRTCLFYNVACAVVVFASSVLS